MDEERFKHLTNLLRHSSCADFHIPSLLFKKESNLKASDEVYQVWKNLQVDPDLTLLKIMKIDSEFITVKLKVKQYGEDD